MKKDERGGACGTSEEEEGFGVETWRKEATSEN